MRHVMGFALLCAGLILIGCSDSQEEPSYPLESATEIPGTFFADALQATRSGELDQLVAMVEWRGVPESVKAFYVEEMGSLVDGSVDSVTFRAIGPNDILRYEVAGQAYEPVLPPAGWARFGKRLPDGQTEWTELLIGKQGDEYRFAPAGPVDR